MSTMYRATTMGLALATAAIKRSKKVDPNSAGEDATRMVLYRMDNTELGVKKERGTNAHLKHSTAKKLRANGVLE
jgi:hypothetical protein